MVRARVQVILLCLAVVAESQVLAGSTVQPKQDVIDIGGSFIRQNIDLPVKEGSPWVIQLPKGSHAASITNGPTDKDIFVVTLVTPSLYHVDLSTNTTRLIYQDKSADPIPINGAVYDKRYNAVWASGSISGVVRVFYLEPDAAAAGSYAVKKTVDVTVVSSQGCKPLQPCSFLLNEIAIGEDNVFVSDSFQPYLYALPRDVSSGHAAVTKVGPLGPKFHCTGPCMAPFSEKANGVAVVDSSTLIMSHWGNGNVYKVSLDGLSVKSVTEIKLPAVNKAKLWGDGMVMAGSHTAYVGNNFGRSVLRLDFNSNYTDAKVTCILQPKIYSTPTNVVVKGDMVWTVQTHYLDCPPTMADCTKQTYEVVGMNAAEVC